MELILKYFPELEKNQIEQFRKLEGLYRDWNGKINVVSRKDIDELYLKHVLHSLAIGKFIEFADGTKILDVGTGGGFPGIPLAILFPNCNFLLVDSINKKLKVVEDVAKHLGLTNVRTEQVRAEEIKKEFDFVVSRAVTTMPVFVGWVKARIKKKQKNKIRNGIIYLKGGDLTEELESYRTVEVVDIQNYFSEDFFDTKKVVYLPIKVRNRA
ncbi:16S rRNA m(7)G-527 methyltransferase [Flavobacteriaceae bacterium MAR_2010_188]|nr:16S rRNA m(7)G-527 methyltransferase [Flavobacteriaceae bacterium MAR_2010_188]